MCRSDLENRARWGFKVTRSSANPSAYAAASQDVGGKLISLSTVESDFGLQGAERKVGRALETVAGVSGAQVCPVPLTKETTCRSRPASAVDSS